MNFATGRTSSDELTGAVKATGDKTVNVELHLRAKKHHAVTRRLGTLMPQLQGAKRSVLVYLQLLPNLGKSGFH